MVSMICGESCTTVMPGSTDCTLAADRFKVSVMVDLLVCVGSDRPTERLLDVSSVMTEDLPLTVIKSAELMPLVQKLAATTPIEDFRTACTLAVFVSTTIAGFAA